MTENQSILKPMGLLDTLSAERLLKKIRERSTAPLMVDCSGITRSLFESMKLFVHRLDAMRAENPDAFRLEFQRVPPGMARQLQLLGKPMRGDSAVLYPPGADAAADRDTRVQMVQCENCAQSIRIEGTGKFACPNCRIRFHVNKFGGASFYEPMLDSSRG